jgi:hypothetical protein
MSKQFDSNNPICKECWGKWVKAQCKGEVEGFDRCEDFKEGCTECLEDFCRDGKENGLCSLHTTQLFRKRK